MRIATAQLPDFDHSDDKIFTTDNALIVLDGASAFRPVEVPASQYAERLGAGIRDALTVDPGADLKEAVAQSIKSTADELQLTPEQSPTSTLAIARVYGDHVDILALGDTPVILPDEIIGDDRIDDLDLPERRQYRERLANGTGYDDTHKALLRELQTKQLHQRNVPGGYWIAGTDPAAAEQAITAQRSVNGLDWLAIATDGAFNTIQHTEHASWHAISNYDSYTIHGLLAACFQWEETQDPHGHLLPRSKRHDDKALAVVHLP